ncbi:phosphate signaling complex protein PhoU [Roseiconus lacunae]|uniref:Phosphate-specific transport system accessory protein PhoU n=1 Tax=Roseiconus lacunae TaxID=2605694 RepID=A0ABT7PFB9_9BACT|nr:phosphate signaling complex protein PhoU [Roseiconus lacunae]MCD0462346.1 phosphate signaling complex protein PhoU [Roseiconus lacunae]MDM4015193.1 phosphate signaling complex protein PhoU [Roseiconus lacunae]WRQ50128.1 phosphate signaling complex protein PhoU [Stieleria sp. HD01]
MSKHLERELERLREQLISQFTLVEQMIQLAVRSLVERRPEFAERVLESDVTVDEMDVRIEEECLKVLALHQPVAFDMRYLIAIDKVNGELERMGDTACNIAERAKALCLFPLFTVPEELSEMVDTSIKMVRRALDSFINCDANMANQVIEMDDIVDALNRVVIDHLQEVMKSDRELIEPAMHCFSASRHLERIGDLAESVCEEVIYLVEGEIVRHKHGLNREAERKAESNAS